MIPTNASPSAIFFADLLLPLHYDNMRLGIKYLDYGLQRESYWEGVVSRTGGMANVNGDALDSSALLGALGDYWSNRKETRLLLLLPYLFALHQSLSLTPSEEQRELELPEYNYPLF